MMRIEYRRSGGIAGIDMTSSIDTQELPAEQAQLVAHLTSGSPEGGGHDGAPDGFSYDLTVDDGECTQRHHWAESEVPEAVRPLLAILADRSRPAPPS